MSSDAASRLCRWVKRPCPRPGAAQVLFCFSHAGGGASVFSNWSRELPAAIELGAFQLPGREDRLSEKPIQALHKLVPQLVEPLTRVADGRPFALFGHSMGALVAYELARMMREPAPSHLFVSGRNGPDHVPRFADCTSLHELPDHELLVELRRMGGTPSEVLNNQELMEILLPAFRADMAIIETYRHQSGKPLSCPLYALGGSEDSLTTRAGLEAWRLHTDAEFQCRVFSGDHFYYLRQRHLLIKTIARAMVGTTTD